MAIDNAAKRYSMIDFGSVSTDLLPFDGNAGLNGRDRIDMLHLYRGVGGGLDVLQALDEVVDIPETSLRVLGVVRAIAETVNLVSAIGRVIGRIWSIDETVNLVESISRARTLIRAITETTRIVEILVDTGVIIFISFIKGVRILTRRKGVDID